MKLYVDMDGTLCQWRDITELEGVEELYKKGFFRDAEPQSNVLEAIRILNAAQVFDSVEILSAYLKDSEFALFEKREWLNKWLPDVANAIFIPCGQSKRFYAFDYEKNEPNVLLDDYSVNLLEWSNTGIGIKLINDMNGSKGTWANNIHNATVDWFFSPEGIAQGIIAGVNNYFGYERISANAIAELAPRDTGGIKR